MLKARAQIPPAFESKPIVDVAAALGLVLEEDRDPWYTCCCPFHAENNPSFRVNVDDNFFRCFGCGVRGDTLELVYLWRSRTNPDYSRYDAYVEVRVGDEPHWVDDLVPTFEDVGPGPRALGEYLASARGVLSREEADRLVAGA